MQIIKCIMQMDIFTYAFNDHLFTFQLNMWRNRQNKKIITLFITVSPIRGQRITASVCPKVWSVKQDDKRVWDFFLRGLPHFLVWFWNLPVSLCLHPFACRLIQAGFYFTVLVTWWAKRSETASARRTWPGRHWSPSRTT